MRLLLVALLGVLAVGVWGAFAVFAASPPPAPTISAQPANPTNQTSASFTYTDSGAITKFQCSRDGQAFVDCGTTRPSSISYSGLGAGSHTFQVRAVASSGTSSATSYTWTVDLTPPMVSSIVLAGATPTNAASVSWTVTFSEDVSGVTAANFGLNASGFASTPTISGVSPTTGAQSVWTVTATTDGATPSGSASEQLKLTSGAGIKDKAGNGFSGSLPFLGATYTVDKTPPPTPSITAGPTAGSLVASTSASFSFTDSEAGAGFQCQLDGGTWASCTSPKAYSGLAQGVHTFAVRAVDAAGNTSGATSRSWSVDTVPPPKPTIVGPNNSNPSTSATFTFTDSEANVTFKCQLDGSGYTPCASPVSYTLLTPGTHVFDVEPFDQAGNLGPFNEWKWTISGLSGSGMPFTISSTATGALLPGGPVIYLNLKLTNPNSVPIYVTSLTVTLSSVTPQPGKSCATSNFNAPTTWVGGYPLMIPANGSKSLSDFTSDQTKWPHLTMKDAGNQDGCKNATVNFSYGGQAQS